MSCFNPELMLYVCRVLIDGTMPRFASEYVRNLNLRGSLAGATESSSSLKCLPNN